MESVKTKRKISFRELWNNDDLSKPSSWGIVGSNLTVIFFVLVDNLNATEVIWVYWIQSVIIGIFNFFRILMLKNFTTEGMKKMEKEFSQQKQ